MTVRRHVEVIAIAVTDLARCARTARRDRDRRGRCKPERRRCAGSAVAATTSYARCARPAGFPTGLLLPCCAYRDRWDRHHAHRGWRPAAWSRQVTTGHEGSACGNAAPAGHVRSRHMDLGRRTDRRAAGRGGHSLHGGHGVPRGHGVHGGHGGHGGRGGHGG